MRRGATLGLACVMAAGLATAFLTDRRGIFLPGRTSDGHHLLEARCASCHEPFDAVSDSRCAGCHRAELRADSHPASMFDDPRWAADLAILDATHCRTCHAEHRVARRGVTIADDFCFRCHDDVVTKRPSHRGFSPDGCATAGCHNYHDNGALNRAFLQRRLGAPDTLEIPAVFARRAAGRPAAVPAPDAPPDLAGDAAIRIAWAGSLHAVGGVNCLDCHGGTDRLAVERRPDSSACRRCHAAEVATFHRGAHGVRDSLGLPPLTPALARVPMRPDAMDGRTMDCAACHDPHSVDTRAAAVTACLRCHDDRHSRNFLSSPHGRTYAADTGARPRERTVTCATCHMPREVITEAGVSRVAVNHNNTLTLAPRDRMMAMACLSCHGLEFSFNSLMDDWLVESNFQTRPRTVHRTVQMLRGSRP